MEIEFVSLFGFNMVSVISIICMFLLAALFILCIFALYNNCFDSSVYLVKQKEIINLFIIKFSKTSQLVDVVCSGEEKYEEK